MNRIAVAMLLSSALTTADICAQDYPRSSASPASESQLPPAQAQGTAPTVFKVCTEKNPPPCATAPKVIKAPDPSYSKAALKQHIEGTAVLWVTVDASGLPRDITVARSVGYGLDEEAIKAVKKWKFKPGTLDAHPVDVQINVEVRFRFH